MTPIAYRDIKFVWVSDHWDFHRGGTCLYEGRLCRFTCVEDYPEGWGTCEHEDGECPLCADYPIACMIHEITPADRMKWRIRKKMFEFCVGTHWTYPNRPNGASFHSRRPRWFYAMLFAIYYKNWRSAWMVFYRWPRTKH